MTTMFTTPNGPLTIRAAGPSDACPLHALRVEALTNNPTVFAADPASTAAEPDALWAERIAGYAQKENGLIGVAAAGDALVGMAGLAVEHWPKTRHSAFIWGVYVQPAWRGCHVAEAILEECFAWARAHGVELVKLGVVTNNAPAIRCYTRCGFTVYGVDPHTLRYAGVSYDELLMVKIL